MPSIKRGHLKLNEKLSPVEITPFKADLLKHGNGMGLLALPQGEQVLELGALDPTPEDEREGWNSKVQFLLSVIAYAVGKSDPAGNSMSSLMQKNSFEKK